MQRERTTWIAAGLLGLVAAIALAVLTNRVSQPPVGLTGQPISAGEALAPRSPAPRSTAAGVRQGPAAPASTAVPAADADRDGGDGASGREGSDDDSGRGRGRGRGRGGRERDDD